MSWRRRRPAGGGQLLEQQLDAHPHEFHQLRVGALVRLLLLAGVDPGARDLGEVAHDLPNLPRQLARVRDGTGAQAVEKSLAPPGQRRGACIDRLSVLRQQQVELHVRLQQGVGSRRIQCAQAGSHGWLRAPLGQDLAQPVLEAVAARATQATGQRAVRLGRVGVRARLRQQLLDVGVVGLIHARTGHYN